MRSTSFAALCVLPTALAHFQLTFPKSRGFSDESEGSAPCGGYDTVASERTDFPIGGGPIQINLGHQQTNIAVYMAIGDNPGNGFNIVAKQQLTVDGLGNFCFGDIRVPEGLNVSDGTKATIQIITDAHESGGLYQCADVTLVNTPLSESQFSDNCKNNTGVKVSNENISGNPNGTSSGHDGDHDEPSSSGSGPAPTSSNAAVPQATALSWMLGAVGAAGLAML